MFLQLTPNMLTVNGTVWSTNVYMGAQSGHFGLTVVYVVLLSGQYDNSKVHCLQLAGVSAFSHQPGPVLLLHIAEDQERDFGTNLMTTMMRMILYMNLAVCILILE